MRKFCGFRARKLQVRSDEEAILDNKIYLMLVGVRKVSNSSDMAALCL
jgi:hypothetical protein